MSRNCKYFASGNCNHGNMCRYKHSTSGRNYYDYGQSYEYAYAENNYQDYEYDYAPAYSYHGRGDKHRGHKESFNYAHHRKSSFDQLIEDIKESASLYEYLKWDLTAMDMGAYLPVGLVEISPEEVRHYTYAIKALGHRLKPFNKLIQKTVTSQQLIYRHLTKMEPATRNTLKELYKVQMDDRDNEDNINDSENLLMEIAAMISSFPRYSKPSASSVTEDVMDVSRAQPEQISTPGPKPTDISFNFARVNATSAHLASTPRVKPAPPNELPIPEPKISYDLPSPQAQVVPPTANDPSIPNQIYAPLDTLTDEEKQAFVAAVFVVGKVPTRPPPLELC